MDESNDFGVGSAGLCDSFGDGDVRVLKILSSLDLGTWSYQVDHDVGVLHCPCDHLSVVEIHLLKCDGFTANSAEFELLDIVVEEHSILYMRV